MHMVQLIPALLMPETDQEHWSTVWQRWSARVTLSVYKCLKLPAASNTHAHSVIKQQGIRTSSFSLLTFFQLHYLIFFKLISAM